VVVGDLTHPADVAQALNGASRMYFNMSLSPDYLLAATVVATVARDAGQLNALVAMARMTVSQMTATSTIESHQQRLHRLSEQVPHWSDLPVIHIRPTMFRDNPLLTKPAAQSLRQTCPTERPRRSAAPPAKPSHATRTCDHTPTQLLSYSATHEEIDRWLPAT